MSQLGLFEPRLELRLGSCDHLFRMYPNTFDCIFADPPYFTQSAKPKKIRYTKSKRLQQQNWSGFGAKWDDGWEDRARYYYWTYAWIEAAMSSLKKDGSIFICGSHHGDWAVNLAIKEMGFYIIQSVSWCIPNAMPHVAGLQMASSNQTIIWARKGKKHYYDKEAAKAYNGGKNLRDYWLINNATHINESKHPSKKPPKLMQRAFDITTREGAVVCDPFGGSGRSFLGARAVRKIEKVVLFERDENYVEEMCKNYSLIKVDSGTFIREAS